MSLAWRTSDRYTSAHMIYVSGSEGQLADLANADEEHVDVGFEKGDFGVGVLVDRWIYISDLEGILCPPLASTPPMMRQSLRSGACWTRGG